MADTPHTPQDFSSNPAPLSLTSTPTGLLEAAYTCPECGAVVVRIVGNTMQFLYTHIRERSDKPDGQGYVSLVFCHTVIGKGDMFVPPRAYVPPLEMSNPFLNVQSSEMVPHPHK